MTCHQGPGRRPVERPLAAPAILAGIETSAVINVGTATIPAFIGASGYGERIVTGPALDDHTLLLAGAIPAAARALAVQGAFDLPERAIVSSGLLARSAQIPPLTPDVHAKGPPNGSSGGPLTL